METARTACFVFQEMAHFSAENGRKWDMKEVKIQQHHTSSNSSL
jgi:hypothetical protein